MGQIGIKLPNSIAKEPQPAASHSKSRNNNFSSMSAWHNAKFMIGKSQAMRDVFHLIEKASQNGATVLISGETGTGKDLVARQLHQRGFHPESPFVVVDCAAIPRELMENELFGHEKGAFTGAYKRMIGKIESAEDGTVFFDDIDCMPLELQAKLLRVLQERNFERVGGTKTISTGARFIFAANQDLKTEMKNGRFREDLFYRIHVFPIYLPPLRERKEDIPILVNYFLRKFSLEQGKTLEKVMPKAMNYLRCYSWPGNVRELENEIERIVTTASFDLTSITPDLLSRNIVESKDSLNLKGESGLLAEAVETLEKRMLYEALTKFHGNKTSAAKYLGLSRRGISKKLARYGMTQAPFSKRVF